MITHKLRLYPNKEQEERLEFAREMCRQTYNTLLGELKEQSIIDKAMIQDRINDLKVVQPELKEVYSKMLQYECYRLFSNLSALKAVKDKGRKVGQMRFKGKNWFKTIQYNQSGFSFQHIHGKNGRLSLSKIGNIKTRQGQVPKEKIKQVTIKKSLGRWYAHLVCEEKKEIQHGDKELGIDLGINHFYTDSEGGKVEHPKIYETYQKKLKKTQQNLSRKKKGSNNRKKAKNKLAKLHQKIDRKRNDFLHKTSTNLIKKCKKLFAEDLNVKQMSEQKHFNAKNINDSSWSKLLAMLEYKAENAGIPFVKVSPTNTTKSCSGCGSIQDMPLYKRTYKCESCGLVLDRDLNASVNIKARGQGLSSVETVSDSNAEQLSMKQEATTSNAV